MSVEIRPVDPHDDDQMRAWYDVYRAAETHDREFHQAYAYEELRGAFRSTEEAARHDLLAAVVDGRVVGTAHCGLRMLDNLDRAEVDVHVHPDHWGRGIGTALLAGVEEIARTEGRRLLIGEASYPYDAPADGSGTGPVEFATRRGFTFGLGDVQRVLDLPVADDLLDELAARAARRHEGYTLRRVSSPVPDDVLLELGRLRGAVETEAPTGEIERQATVPDARQVREDEETAAAMGRTRHAVLAIAPDGAVAGYVEVVHPEHDPGWLYQWGTLVWPSHRGHALGLALKVDSTRWLQELYPDRKAIRTWNAEVNAPMIAVNEALGYRPVSRLGEFQKVLSP